MTFIENVGDKVKMNNEAFAMTKVLIGRIKQHKETKAIIDEVETLLSEVDGVSPVHSPFYLLSSDLYRIQGKHKDFYRSSLRFLGCTDVEEMSQEEKAKHAFFLSLAALLGDKVFNFGDCLPTRFLSP